MKNTVPSLAVLLLLLWLSFSSSDGQSTEELFSFEKLAKYTSLASCFALIHEDFAYCNQKAEEKGKKYLEGIDMSSEWARRVKCCGTWKLRDCWVKFAKQKCTRMQAEQVHALPYTFVKNLEEACKNYPPGSDKCGIPWWLIVIVVLAALLLVALGAWLGFRCYRRRKLNKINKLHQRQMNNVHENEKLKTVV